MTAVAIKRAHHALMWGNRWQLAIVSLSRADASNCFTVARSLSSSPGHDQYLSRTPVTDASFTHRKRTVCGRICHVGRYSLCLRVYSFVTTVVRVVTATVLRDTITTTTTPPPPSAPGPPLSLQSSRAVWKSRWPSWAPVPNKPTVSVDVKEHSTPPSPPRTHTHP